MSHGFRFAITCVLTVLLGGAMGDGAYAQVSPTDWVLGSWTANTRFPGANFPPWRLTFVRQGNETRGISENGANFVRAITDNFGVVSWQAWIAPQPIGRCASQQGEWISATTTIAPDHHTITVYVPVRNGDTCQIGNTTVETDLTR